MEGCFANMMKYLLFITNFIVFVLGLVTLGFGTWILVDKPSFLNLFTDAENILNENDIDIGQGGFDLGIYAGAPILLIIIAIFVVLVSFFGCCGAIKESRCMLTTYFVLILAIFIGGIVGAVLIFQGTLDSEIKDPLFQSIKFYNDKPEDASSELAFKNVWNTVQEELRCCGVNNATDWDKVETPNWEEGNKPKGCCTFSRGQEQENNATQITNCRKAEYGNEKYYFKGCYTVIKEEIEGQQNKIFGAAMGTIAVMFLNMLFSFALCSMVD